ncbi:MAG: peptidoglycan -binding protein [Kiloniellaceae bacterium]
MRIPALSSCLCVVLVASALAQDGAPPKPTAATDYDEIEALIGRIQARVDNMNKTASDTDVAMAFLSRQVEEAIRKLASRQDENAALRQQAIELSKELDSLATRREELGSEVARLTTERDKVFAALESQVRELAGLLSLEREATADLRKGLDARAAELRATVGERDRIALQLRDARTALAAQKENFATRLNELKSLKGDIAELRSEREALQARLAVETATLDTTKAELEAVYGRNSALEDELSVTNSRTSALSRQLVQLRAQIAELSKLLAASESRNHQQQEAIADLGRRLNLALARKVRELAKYRSEFFGRLREVLGERPDIRIVGDRFVFQSEVLFHTGEAELEEPGRRQLRRLAQSLKEIAATIPSDIDWVLRVDGHTDERPIRTARFPSNWELSTARATSVVKFLMAQEIPAGRLAAAGFAQFHPLDRRRDEMAFRRNRRIEFRLTQR